MPGGRHRRRSLGADLFHVPRRTAVAVARREHRATGRVLAQVEPSRPWRPLQSDHRRGGRPARPALAAHHALLGRDGWSACTNASPEPVPVPFWLTASAARCAHRRCCGRGLDCGAAARAWTHAITCGGMLREMCPRSRRFGGPRTPPSGTSANAQRWRRFCDASGAARPATCAPQRATLWHRPTPRPSPTGPSRTTWTPQPGRCSCAIPPRVSVRRSSSTATPGSPWQRRGPWPARCAPTGTGLNGTQLS